MNDALRTLFRLVFCFWFGLVLLCGAAVSWKTQSSDEVGSLLPFLFTRYVAPSTTAFLPAFESPAPEPVAEPPAVEPPVVEPPKPTEYPILPRGTGKGKGQLNNLQVTSLPDGSVEARLQYTGQPGQMTSFADTHFRAVDLHGDWPIVSKASRLLDSPLVRLVQLGYHKSFIRISATRTAKTASTPLLEEVRYSPTEIIIRFYEK